MNGRIFCLMLLAGVVGGGEPRHFSSGPVQTHLIELFTSEGCSSCPPAEAWLNDLQDNPGLWRDFVPVAFHVNYWDRLGWTDRFSNRQFTDRQYNYGSVWGVSTVYTPGFVLDGKDWRERSGRKTPGLGGKTGVLAVELAENHGVVNFENAGATKNAYEVHVALLGGGFESQVKAGENRGRTLAHEFVVLKLFSLSMREGQAEFNLPAVKMEGLARRSLAVWVTRRGDTEPLQATGGWLD